MRESQHIVHEAYGDYRERMSSGNFLVYIFLGALIGMVGLLMFSFSKDMVDRVFFIAVIVLGVWIMWKNVIPSNKLRYRDTAHRISYG